MTPEQNTASHPAPTSQDSAKSGCANACPGCTCRSIPKITEGQRNE